MANPFLTSLFEYKAWCNRGLFEALRAAPEGEHPGEMAVILLTLDHAWRVDETFRARIAGEKEPFEHVVGRKLPVLSELAESVAATDAWLVAYTERASRAELEEKVAFTFIVDGMKGSMTREEMLAHILTHNGSHRGAVGKMMEQIGVRGTSDMFTTYLHQQSPAPCGRG
jgi:uncharacterized damage-inducible protein DinB